MERNDDRTWLEFLSEAACWELLHQTPVGRVGVLVDSAPEIYPVNFVVAEGTIVFRTDPGSKLRGLDRSPSVCFEVDGFDDAEATGWSVLVKGRAQEIVHGDEVHRVSQLRLRYWGLDPKSHWIRITPAEVTGRRILRGQGRSTA